MKTTRRSFMAQSALATAALALPRFANASVRRNDADTLVIGAGIAGLAAARHLIEAGLRVIVLEARDRIGGRLRSLRTAEGRTFDMGASWIHGDRGNPITTLARDLNVPTMASPDALYLVDATGQPIDEVERDKLGARLLNMARRKIRSESASIDDTIQLSGIADNLNQRDRILFRSYLHSWIEQEYAADTGELSAEHFDAGEEDAGSDRLLPGGYDQLATGLAARMDIRLATPVRHIRHTKHSVTVETTNGIFTADTAVITLPLGVLKAGDVAFDPPLPPPKCAAIERLGMGLLNKVWLRFPTKFWAEPGWIERAVLPSAWALFYATPFPDPTLIAFTCGSHARLTEQATDHQQIDAAMTGLRACYGPDIPSPVEFHATRWLSDPFSRGAYSFIATGATPNDRATLAASTNRLYFAGEACDSHHPSTVHGAFQSGLSAARNLLKEQT